MKKYLFAVLLPLMLLFTTAAAAGPTLFPVETVGEDGVARWGYMDESGGQPIGFFYAEAGVFNEYGLAAVQNAQGQTGVIDASGRQVIAYQETPQSVDFNAEAVAFHYAGRTLFFAHDGTPYDTVFPAGVGFFEDGFLRVRENGLWGYALRDGSMGIPAQFAEAGDFVNGRALVRKADGAYAVLSRDGTLTPLPGDAAYLSIYAGDLAILRDGGAMRLYSLSEGDYLSEMIYQEISPYHDDGYAMVKQGNKWGIITPKENVSVEPQYYYLSYMGEGVYAARGENGEVLAIDANGTRIYYTDTYVGGFETFRFGLSWHGTMNGGVMFFNKNGVFSRKIDGAENPEIVSGDVAAVTVDGSRQYIRLSDGKVLYAPARVYQLDGGVQVETRKYERYVGTQKDGTEYGWHLSYPQFTGMKDAAVQAKVNSAIEKFFLDGPSDAARRQSLVGDYGFAFYGRVLVVYADATLGLGEGATLWNDSIALDFSTGQRYTVTGNLLLPGYESTLSAQLPARFSSYDYVRMAGDHLTLFRNIPATQSSPARAETAEIPYNSIWDVIDTDSACYRALSSSAAKAAEATVPDVVAEAAPAQRFTDVPATHWAYEYIENAAARGLMTGSGGRFEPDRPVLACEAAASLTRALGLAPGAMPGLDSGEWYAPEVGAAYEAGLLGGLEAQNWDAALPRADVMQLAANTVRRDGKGTLSDLQVVRSLARYSDTVSIPANRREAAAFCVQKGLITGSNGRLTPQAPVTRAEFAKLLLSISEAK